MNIKDVDICKKYIDAKQYACGFCFKDLNIDNIQLIDRFYPIKIENKFICKDCAKTKFMECVSCHQLILNGNSIYIEELHGQICNTCQMNIDIYKCKDCNKFFMTDYRDISLYGTVCKNCFDKKHTFHCDNCDNTYLSERYGINGICITCANEQVENCLYYTFKPHPIFFKNGNTDIDKLFMGMELECGYAKNAKNVMKFISNVNEFSPFYYMKRDASIPAYGCEIVTHPATIDYHLKQANWKRIIEFAEQAGLNSDNEKCGIHIHMNRSFFDMKDINFLDFFVNENDDLFKKLARRESHYSEYVKKTINNWGRQTTNRHCALNLSNENTIELRIFKGTLNIDILFAYLQLTYCLAYYAKEHSCHQCSKKDFIDYCINKNYIELNNYLINVLKNS